MENKQYTLQKDTVMDGKYTVLFFIKKGQNAETYRVKGTDGKVYFLKLFNVAKLHLSAFDRNGNLLEIEILKKTAHENIVSYKDDGEVIVGNKKFLYLVLKFIVGETLAEQLTREPVSTVFDIRHILSGVLSGLQYLHSLPEPVIHNEITPQNIMIDLSTDTPQAKIIDFGYARSFLQSLKMFNRQGLNLNYVASECITAGLFSPQSDLFSVGVVMYQMLFGIAPWNVSVSEYEAQISGENIAAEKLLKQREKPLMFPDIAERIADFDDSILKIITKALQTDTERRFRSAQEFLEILNSDSEDSGQQWIAGQERNNGRGQGQNEEHGRERNNKPGQADNDKYGSVLNNEKKGKGGFAAIAGMQALKNMLQTDVIDLIRNPEEYRQHGLGLPNGMLLYGPPGCGKTFFAERFAEETGYNFRKIIASDLASIYVHGTQEKIGKIFDEARKNAPAILYFDELDAMTPDRENAQHSYGSEVNEFLSQLDNIGDSGVFVIGSTNKPQLIDKAILRAGRLEKHFYIPPPDFEARRAMFEIYLKHRPIDFGIDYEKLAAMTEYYVSGDIKLIVDEASRKVIREKTKRITMETLEIIIISQRPTISLEILQQYDGIKNSMEGKKEERRRVGFNR
ncbi:MAG: AAA family ATPase [Tannerella sp.]|jgi:transitional endoplasmic reticulum ATPase|nr:AAA family ATPase [Tannerella sp.]